jgi:hypothetical protein
MTIPKIKSFPEVGSKRRAGSFCVDRFDVMVFVQ